MGEVTWWCKEEQLFYEKTVRAKHFVVKHFLPCQHMSPNSKLPFQAGFIFIMHFDHTFARKEIRNILTVLCVIMSLI